MKLISILHGFIYGSITFIIGPFLFLRLNEFLYLPVFSFPYVKVFGLILGIVSLLVFFYCVNLFWFLGKGTPTLPEPPKKLVIKGLYKHTRNPIYVTHSMILFSYALIFGHLMLFIYFFLALFLYNLMVVFFEEPRLKKQFGRDYLKYMKRVPRWLLRIK